MKHDDTFQQQHGGSGMYKRILHEEAFWMKPARHSTWLVRYANEPFYVLLIEDDCARARRAIQHLNLIASCGTLRGRIPVICMRTIEHAHTFIDLHPYFRFKFILVNAIGHTESRDKALRFVVELQDRCGFPGEIAILSNHHHAPINQRLERLHSKKRAAPSTAAP